MQLVCNECCHGLDLYDQLCLPQLHILPSHWAANRTVHHTQCIAAWLMEHWCYVNWTLRFYYQRISYINYVSWNSSTNKMTILGWITRVQFLTGIEIFSLSPYPDWFWDLPDSYPHPISNQHWGWECVELYLHILTHLYNMVTGIGKIFISTTK